VTEKPQCRTASHGQDDPALQLALLGHCELHALECFCEPFSWRSRKAAPSEPRDERNAGTSCPTCHLERFFGSPSLLAGCGLGSSQLEEAIETSCGASPCILAPTSSCSSEHSLSGLVCRHDLQCDRIDELRGSGEYPCD